MELIPLELHIHHIFNQIDTTSVVRSKRVSKFWKELIEQILPFLEIDVSHNEFISDEDLGVFSQNKIINLSYCLNLTGSTMWWIWPDKLNIEGCVYLGDCVFKYLGSVKELNINGIYNDYGHRIKHEVFLRLETLFVKSGYGSGYDLEMLAPDLTELTIQDFRISSDLFYRHQNLKQIHFINCTFSSDFYYSFNKEYCKSLKFITLDYCSDQVYSDVYDETYEHIVVFITNYLPDNCLITFHGKINDDVDISNLPKEEFLKHKIIQSIKLTD